MFWEHKNSNAVQIKREKSIEELRSDLKKEIQLGLGKGYELYAELAEDFFDKHSEEIISWMLNHFDSEFQALKFSKVFESLSELCSNMKDKITTYDFITKENWMKELPHTACFNTVDSIRGEEIIVKVAHCHDDLITFLFFIGVKTEILFNKSDKKLSVIFRFYEDLTEKLTVAKRNKSTDYAQIRESVRDSMGADYAEYAQMADKFWAENSEEIMDWMIDSFVSNEKGLKFVATFGNGHGGVEYEKRVISRLIPLKEWMTGLPVAQAFNTLPTDEIALSAIDVHFITHDHNPQHDALMAFLYYVGLKKTSAYDNKMSNWMYAGVKYILTFREDISSKLLSIKNVMR